MIRQIQLKRPEGLETHQFGISVFTSRYKLTESRSSALTASMLPADGEVVKWLLRCLTDIS